jgi:hypothetical protein
MKKHFSFLIPPRWALLAGCLCLNLLTACAKTNTTSVNIHGVNYTEQEFSYRVTDPGNKDNHGGGEIVDSFSAGGTLCCYELPRKWRPGILVEIHTIRWIDKPPDHPEKAIEEINETHRVEVPQYVDGKPGELWVVRQADGTFGVVSSDYQPDHAKWPGAVKGWPVPTLEYRRKLFDVNIKHQEDYVNSFQNSLAELEVSPLEYARSNWESKQKEVAMFANSKADNSNTRQAREYRELLKKFSGPDDPKFIEMVKNEFKDLLLMSQKELQKLKDARP